MGVPSTICVQRPELHDQSGAIFSDRRQRPPKSSPRSSTAARRLLGGVRSRKCLRGQSYPYDITRAGGRKSDRPCRCSIAGRTYSPAEDLADRWRFRRRSARGVTRSKPVSDKAPAHRDKDGASPDARRRRLVGTVRQRRDDPNMGRIGFTPDAAPQLRGGGRTDRPAGGAAGCPSVSLILREVVERRAQCNPYTPDRRGV